MQDYRELGGERFDRVASIGMVEHVGAVNIDAYAQHARRRAGAGRGAAQPRHRAPAPRRPRGRARSPSASCSPTPRRCTSRGSSSAFEKTDSTIDHIEGFAPDYAETLRHWARRLDDRHDEAVRLAGPERVRVWRLYLRAARRGFETGFTSVYQVRARA